jgi:hypothetical protein
MLCNSVLVVVQKESRRKWRRSPLVIHNVGDSGKRAASVSAFTVVGATVPANRPCDDDLFQQQ